MSRFTDLFQDPEPVVVAPEPAPEPEPVPEPVKVDEVVVEKQISTPKIFKKKFSLD